jgi:hypothetical protein
MKKKLSPPEAQKFLVALSADRGLKTKAIAG